MMTNYLSMDALRDNIVWEYDRDKNELSELMKDPKRMNGATIGARFLGQQALYCLETSVQITYARLHNPNTALSCKDQQLQELLRAVQLKNPTKFPPKVETEEAGAAERVVSHTGEDEMGAAEGAVFHTREDEMGAAEGAVSHTGEDEMSAAEGAVFHTREDGTSAPSSEPTNDTTNDTTAPAKSSSNIKRKIVNAEPFLNIKRPAVLKRINSVLNLVEGEILQGFNRSASCPAKISFPTDERKASFHDKFKSSPINCAYQQEGDFEQSPHLSTDHNFNRKIPIHIAA